MPASRLLRGKPKLYLVIVHKIKEVSGADLTGKILVPSNLDDGVQVRLQFLLLLLLLLCLFRLHHTISCLQSGTGCSCSSPALLRGRLSAKCMFAAETCYASLPHHTQV